MLSLDLPEKLSFFKGTKVCSEFKTGLGKVEDKYSTADGVYVNIMKTTFLFNFLSLASVF